MNTLNLNHAEFKPRQLEIITGNLLGDATLNKIKNSKSNSSLKHKQSGNREEYIRWLSSEFEPFSKKMEFRTTPARIRIGKTIVNDYSRTLATASVRTCSHPIFTELEHKWYKIIDGKRTKILPDDLKLTPLTVAMWYCDDGSHKPKAKSVDFSTHSFSTEECQRLVDLLMKMDIHAKLSPHDGRFIVYVRSKSYIDFMDMIRPYMIFKCFDYKLLNSTI